MTTFPGAAGFIPPRCDTSCLREAVRSCRGCDLYARATQAVFGQGDTNARLMVVGEQPGDEEDVAGEPFVGPAGVHLDTLLERAGIPRDEIWLTNAVKHFKFEAVREGKRMHKKPTMLEVKACRPWLDAEIRIVRPDVIVALGSTAAQSLLGGSFRVTHARGVPQEAAGLPPIVATWHPAAILRAPVRSDRHRMRDEVVKDLERAERMAAVPVS